MSTSAGAGSQAARTLGGLYSTFDKAHSGSQALAKMHQRNAAYQRGRCLHDAQDADEPTSPDQQRRPSPARTMPLETSGSNASMPSHLSDDEVVQAAFDQLCQQVPPAAASVSAHAITANPLQSMDPLRILQWTWARSMETPQKRHRFLTALKRSAGCSEERAVEDVQRLETLVFDFERGALQWNVLGGVGSLVEDGLMKSFEEVLSGEGQWSLKAEAVWRAALVHFKEPPLRYC